MATRSKGAWPREQANGLAVVLKNLLADDCERIEIAGSVRRGKDVVGDLELLAIPKLVTTRSGEVNLLDLKLEELLDQGVLDYRLDKNGRRSFGKLNKFMVHRNSGMPVDLFIAGAENWGMALLVRTGPKAFNIKVMAHFRKQGMRGHAYGGVSDRNGEEIICPDEEAVFNLLAIGFIPPQYRR